MRRDLEERTSRAVFGYRVGARKSAKWCAASCAGADTWSMARGSGRGGGSKAPRREQEPRQAHRGAPAGERQAERGLGTHYPRPRPVEAAQRPPREAARRRPAGRPPTGGALRQGRRQGRGGRPGRRPGAGYGRQTRRRPPRVDETHAARPQGVSRLRGAVEVARVAAQYQEDLPPVHPIVRRFDIEVGHEQCRRRVQGRHRLQTSDALGAASGQLGPEGRLAAVSCTPSWGSRWPRSARAADPAACARRPRGLLHRAARDAGPAYRELCRQVRNAPVVTPDETGWRVGATPLAVDVRHPGDHRLRHLPRPHSTTPPPCSGPTTRACSCATGGWCIAATRGCTRAASITSPPLRKLREGHPRVPGARRSRRSCGRACRP